MILFYRILIAAFAFERDTAINPKVRMPASLAISRFEGLLARKEIQR